MSKGPGLYADIGKKARDLLYKDYQGDHKFTLTTYSPTGVAITSSGTKKGDLFLADVNTQFKHKNITTDVKVDTSNNLSFIVTAVDLTPGLKTIFNFKVPDESSGKNNRWNFSLHDYVGLNTSIGLTANPIVNLSGVLGSRTVSAGTDVSFDTKTGTFLKCNAGLSFSNADLIAALTLNDKGETLNASYYHILNPLTAVGAEIAHSISSTENTITLGTQHALSPWTVVKGRVNNYGKTSALIQHEWRPKSLFTISAEVDTKAIEQSAKVGLALALKP